MEKLNNVCEGNLWIYDSWVTFFICVRLMPAHLFSGILVSAPPAPANSVTGQESYKTAQAEQLSFSIV